MWSLLPCPDPSCPAPAEATDRVTLESTDGPIEHIKTLCLNGHRFFMPTDRAQWPQRGTRKPAHSESGQSA
jgi:hypothetical protein